MTHPLWKIALVALLAGAAGMAVVVTGYTLYQQHQGLVATFPQIVDALNKHEAALQKLTGGPVAAPQPATPAAPAPPTP